MIYANEALPDTFAKTAQRQLQLLVLGSHLLLEHFLNLAESRRVNPQQQPEQRILFAGIKHLGLFDRGRLHQTGGNQLVDGARGDEFTQRGYFQNLRQRPFAVD